MADVFALKSKDGSGTIYKKSDTIPVLKIQCCKSSSKKLRSNFKKSDLSLQDSKRITVGGRAPPLFAKANKENLRLNRSNRV